MMTCALTLVKLLSGDSRYPNILDTAAVVLFTVVRRPPFQRALVPPGHPRWPGACAIFLQGGEQVRRAFGMYGHSKGTVMWSSEDDISQENSTADTACWTGNSWSGGLAYDSVL